jgi:hypothetical protein
MLTITGCGFDATQSASSPMSAAVTGIVHGGPNPVNGATVKLYATASNGYGGAGTLLATTTTNSSGSFTFSSPATCTSGQQAYVTAAAGNTGANSTNNNSLLMAALGPCSALSSSTSILIDEPSTIAAAYALSNFITISGTGSSMVVGVSSSGNNDAGSGSCTVTSGVTTNCQAAGLAHAFLNAANLVHASNISGIDSTAPTGAVYASPPSNSTTSLSSSTQPALLNVVPQQLINSLADSVEACVNSNGTTTPCTTLFTNTTVSANYTSNTTYTTAPTNTLQALVNLAKFPFTGVSGVYGVGSGNSYYQPSLTAAPPDWSIAIVWRSYAVGANQIGSVYYTTLDINDDVYTSGLTSVAAGGEAGAAPVIANALTSGGVGIWSAPATISTNTTNVCNVYAGTALNDPPCMAATDTLGHLWVANGQSQSSQSGVYTTGYLVQVNTSTGAATQFTVPSTSDDPLGLAVDKSNDVFFSTSNVSSTNDLWELPQGSVSSTSPTAVTFNGSAYQGAHSLGSLAFDASGNLWGSHNSGSGTGYLYAANTGTFPAEAFANTNAGCDNCNSGTAVSNTEGINSEPSASVIDASGNYWFTGQKGLYEIPVGGGGTTGAGSTAYTLGTSNQQMRLLSMDGAGTIFVPDNDSNGPANPLAAGGPTELSPVLRIFYPAFPTQLTVSIAGCNVGTATGNTTCITTNAGAPNNQMFYQAMNVAIDSTGSMWVSSVANDGIIQVIGTAAPTWPQLSYLKPAALPQ